MSSNQAHPTAQETAAARRQQAFEYRIAGNSYRKIAEKLGVSHTQVENDVHLELAALAKRTAAAAETLRELELSRLDAAQAAIAAQVSAGHLGAIDRWVRISERRAKLLGLDAPTRQEHTGAAGGPIEMSDATDQSRVDRLAALLNAAGARRDGRPAPPAVAAPGGAADGGVAE